MSTIHYEVIGCGPEIVLLHGWGWHSGIWQPLLLQLKKCYRLILVDLPGFGKSPSLSQDYCLHNVAQEILKVAPNNTIWIGWSLGGLVATWIAIHYPLHVKKLILLACSPRFLQDDYWPGVKRSSAKQFMHSLEIDIKNTLKRFLILQYYQDINLDKYKLYLKRLLFSKKLLDLDTLKQSLKLLFNTDLRHELINIQCPSLLILGENDFLIPVNIIKKIQNYMPQLQLVVIPNAGHIPFLSNPQWFCKILDGFLQGNYASKI